MSEGNHGALLRNARMNQTVRLLPHTANRLILDASLSPIHRITSHSLDAMAHTTSHRRQVRGEEKTDKWPMAGAMLFDVRCGTGSPACPVVSKLWPIYQVHEPPCDDHPHRLANAGQVLCVRSARRTTATRSWFPLVRLNARSLAACRAHKLTNCIVHLVVR